MGHGVTLLRKVLLGQESTAAQGTAVAATTYWRGMGALEDTRGVEQPEEHVGLLSKTTRNYTPRLGAAISMDGVPATFEQIGHIFAASMEVSNPVADGSGSDYIDTFDAPATAARPVTQLQTYTIEGGDNEQVERMEYAFVESWELSGNSEEAVMMTADWLGRQVADTAGFSAGATRPTVEEILFNKGKLYIDNVGGSIGSTQITEAFIGFTLSYTSGWRAVFTGDGNLYFTIPVQKGPEATLELTLEHTTAVAAEKDNFQANTPRLVRLEFEGTAVSTAGTTYSNKTLILDCAGFWEEWPALEDEDGDSVISPTLRLAYDETAALFMQAVVVNEQSALP